MTNREMMEIAMRQSAEDMGCRVEDLKADKNVVVPINLGKKARKYLKELLPAIWFPMEIISWRLPYRRRWIWYLRM